MGFEAPNICILSWSHKDDYSYRYITPQGNRRLRIFSLSALIPKKEIYGSIKVGDKVTARVTAIKADGKLNLSIREKAYLQMDVDAVRVMDLIDSYDGVLPFTDKANPEVIRRELQMSKNEFKRAVGRLLKEGKIEITEKAIRRK